MNLLPLSQSEEAAWHERIRRRELLRCSFTLQQLADNVQFTEDFASETPKILAKLIGVTAKLLSKCLESKAPAQDLEQVNTVLGIITSHLRYVERARIAQTPWSVIQSAEQLLKLAVGSNSHFIFRPAWAYNYSIIGEFASAYRDFLSCWSWFPLPEWKEQIGISDDEFIYCISFPRIERSNCLLHANWGHEVGHILAAKWVNTNFGTAWASNEIEIKLRIWDHVKNNLPPVPLFRDMVIQEDVAKQLRVTMESARHGLVELLCDMVGVHILGPSFIAAAMEFAARFAMDVSPLQSSYYPPWRYRIRMMLQHCDPDLNDNIGIGYPNQEIKSFIEWLKRGQRLTAVSGDFQVIQANVVTDEAYKFISTHFDKAAQEVLSMLPTALAQPYRLYEHHDIIAKLIVRLQQGVPPNEICHLSMQPASFQDILTAAWAHKMNQIDKNPSWGNSDEYNLLFRLVLKGCESSYVHSEFGRKIIAQKP